MSDSTTKYSSKTAGEQSSVLRDNNHRRLAAAFERIDRSLDLMPQEGWSPDEAELVADTFGAMEILRAASHATGDVRQR